MGWAVLAVRLLLASVFAVSGFAKLADRAGTAESAQAFGVSAAAADVVAVLLPAMELTVAALLLIQPTATAGLVAAAALLVTFSAAITHALRRGEAPECRCFGRLRRRPTSWRTLARDLTLAAVALGAAITAAGDAGPSPVRWIGTMSIPAVVASAAVAGIALMTALQVSFCLQLLHQHGRILNRLDELERAIAQRAPGVPGSATGAAPVADRASQVGRPAPDVTLHRLDGRAVSLRQLHNGDVAVALLFVDPSCRSCRPLFKRLAEWQRDRAGAPAVVAVSRGTVPELRRLSRAYGLRELLRQSDWEVASQFGVRATPSALLIDAGGRIGSPVAVGETAIVTLIEATTAPVDRSDSDRAAQSLADAGGVRSQTRLTIGARVPEFALSALNGAVIRSEDLRGRDVLMVFWDPACGFCRSMAEDLRDWSRRRTTADPELLFVAASQPGAGADRFDALMIIDSRWTLARRFGVAGTPSAVRLDADGTVASDVAVGAEAVLRLAALPGPEAMTAVAAGGPGGV